LKVEIKAVLVAALYVLMLTAGYSLIKDDYLARTVFGDLWFIVGDLGLLWLTLEMTKHFSGDSKKVWTMVLIGFSGWFVGDVIWAFYELVLNTISPYPSIADLSYIFGSLSLAVGFFAEAKRIRSYSLAKAAVAVLLGIALFYSMSLAPITSIIGDAEVGAIEKAVSVAYPVSDALMFSAAAYLALIYGGIFRRAWLLLSAGAMAWAFSDSLWAELMWLEIYDANYFLVDHVWLIGYALMGLGIWSILELTRTLPGLAKAKKPAR